MIFELSSNPHHFMVLSIGIPCIFQLERLFYQFQEFSLFLFLSFFPYNGRAVNLLKNWILKTMTALTSALSVLPLTENPLYWWNSRHLEGDACHIYLLLLCPIPLQVSNQYMLLIFLQFYYSSSLCSNGLAQNPLGKALCIQAHQSAQLNKSSSPFN